MLTTNLLSSRFCYRFFFKINLFIYFWLCWVFVSVRGLSLVAESGGHSSSQCAGLSLSRPLLLRSTGSGRAGSVVVAHGSSCSAACGIFPDQGSNPCPLHWQADSQPLHHREAPLQIFWSLDCIPFRLLCSKVTLILFSCIVMFINLINRFIFFLIVFNFRVNFFQSFLFFIEA